MNDTPIDTLDGTHRSVVVVGGGQAGLSISHELAGRNIDHIVLERSTIGSEWKSRRWDSFCLVTPNRQCLLPGFPYSGNDPDGFMVRDEIVSYIEAYAASFSAPVLEGVEVRGLAASADGYAVRTDRGTVTADQVVLAAGPYHSPSIPRMAERLPSSVVQMHSSEYKNAASLPPGAVLVVGTGQSGCQIAEDLHLEGRSVHLATGTAPRVARRYRGRDCMTWLDEIGHYTKGIDTFADQEATRFKVNHYVTGRDGGRDIDLRAFARDGMSLYGRASGVSSDGSVMFLPNLASNLDGADAVAESIKDLVDGHILQLGLEAPEEARYEPVWQPSESVERLDLLESDVNTVIWATGYTRDYRWIDLPIFDGRGYPTHHRGVTSRRGVYVLGMPWQWTWGSGRFRGVGDDAVFLAERIQALVGERLVA